jgi:hypothetical protein
LLLSVAMFHPRYGVYVERAVLLVLLGVALYLAARYWLLACSRAPCHEECAKPDNILRSPVG